MYMYIFCLLVLRLKHPIQQGSLTIWPVYAYILAASNTVIKLLTLIFYTEDNSSMYYEGICVQIFTYSVIIW